MQVTSLVENSRVEGRDDLEAEFGLSLLVERDGSRILFDTGASAAFVSNADRLGFDIAEVDVAVLSHHHFDHGGGLEAFFERNSRARVHLRSCRPADRFFRALMVISRPIGLDVGLLDRFEDRFEAVSGVREIDHGAFLLTDIGSEHDCPRGNRHLFVERDGQLVPDPFDHELLMVIH
jgi:7,8-dihydropterin-6-yl-methyl-4-(beta-D-ribofuranosyl)aminobenzene 5'-phosphate synthase